MYVCMNQAAYFLKNQMWLLGQLSDYNLPSNMVFWRVFLHVLFLIINFKNLLLLQTNIFLEEFFRTNPTQTKYLIFEFISSRKKN